MTQGAALSRYELINTLTAYSGTTTADGNAGGTTLIDANLINNPRIAPTAIPGKTVLIMPPGNARGWDKGVLSFNNVNGTITLVGTGTGIQILRGTNYRILNISTTEIDVAVIDGKIGTNLDPIGTTTLFAWLAKVWGGLLGATGLCYGGTVTGVPGANQFTIASLAGLGAGKFADVTAPYRAFVLRDAGGASAAPQGEMQTITAYVTGTGAFTAIGFGGGGVAINDEVLILHPRIAEVADIDTKAEAIQYHDRVFYDSVTGIGGITWPVGTPQVPSNVIANVITICAARNLSRIDVHGGLQLGAAMEHYTFFGHFHEDITDVIDLNGQDVDNSRFNNCLVTGAQGGTLLAVYVNCVLYNVSGFRGMAENCPIYTPLAVSTGISDFDRCTSLHGVITVTVGAPARLSFKHFAGGIILTAQTAGVALVSDISGSLEINAMTGGSLDVHASSADIIINANCIGGTINIYGNARVTDNSAAGCTVNDYTIQATGGALALTTFTQETHAAVNANGVNWVDLLDMSVITKPTKVCGFMVTVSGGWAGKARLRITDGAGTTKIFPFQAYYEQDTDFTSAIQAVFNFGIVVPVANGYKVQFCSSNAGDVGAGFDVTLNNLDVVEVG